MSAAPKTALLLLVAIFAFQFGGYVTKGSNWITLICFGALLAGAISILLREFWKPKV
jgi:hypothetical protein